MEKEKKLSSGGKEPWKGAKFALHQGSDLLGYRLVKRGGSIMAERGEGRGGRLPRGKIFKTR